VNPKASECAKGGTLVNPKEMKFLWELLLAPHKACGWEIQLVRWIPETACEWGRLLGPHKVCGWGH